MRIFRRNRILRPKLPYLTGRQGIRSARLKKVFRAAKELAAFTYPRSAKIGLLTHPIFESDFDCLTGKNRLHANPTPIPTRLL